MIEDAEIVRLFYERSEQAIGELDRKYEKLFHSLAYHILNNRQDAEECVNEAYLSVWNTIPPAQPDPLRKFSKKQSIPLLEELEQLAIK